MNSLVEFLQQHYFFLATIFNFVILSRDSIQAISALSKIYLIYKSMLMQCNINRITGKDNTVFLNYKAIIILLFTFVDTNDLMILILLVFGLGSSFCFFIINKNSVYLNTIYSKLINM